MTTLAAVPTQRPPLSTAWAGEWGQLGRIPADLWEALAEDEVTAARYHAKLWHRAPGQCVYYLGAVSSSGHGRFRAGTRRLDATRPASIMVPAHVYGWVLSRSVPAPDPVTGELPVIRHRCDESLCQAVAHLAAGSPAANVQDYLGRRDNPRSPLQDSRGPRGRAVAIRDAIRAALSEGASRWEIEAEIEAASMAGMPRGQLVLPF